MPEKENKIVELIKAHLSRDLLPGERQELEAWMNEDAENYSLVEYFLDEKKLLQEVAATEQAKEKIWLLLMQKLDASDIDKKKRPLGKVISGKTWYWVAASIVLLLVIGVYYGITIKKNENTAIAKKPIHDIQAPETNKAMITLADGHKVFLDEAKDGQLATVGAIELVKLDDGVIAYKGIEKNAGKPVFNTLTNPRGSKPIAMTLSDGSKIWLNSESSITYPVVFTGIERRVILNGEGYFEVAKNKNRKFVVQSGNILTEVLGTHFNINAYEIKNSVKTTLLEGKVQVINSGKVLLLNPGQQAIAQNNGSLSKNNVDTDRVMAWKNGFFDFDDMDLGEVLEELSRWYGIRVSHSNIARPVVFGGRISRNVDLKDMIFILKQSGLNVHWNASNHELLVSP